MASFVMAKRLKMLALTMTSLTLDDVPDSSEISPW